MLTNLTCAIALLTSVLMFGAKISLGQTSSATNVKSEAQVLERRGMAPAKVCQESSRPSVNR